MHLIYLWRWGESNPRAQMMIDHFYIHSISWVLGSDLKEIRNDQLLSLCSLE